MISLKRLCREAPGNYVLSYGEVAANIRKVSSAPQEDVDRFFRQMVFNAGTGCSLLSIWRLMLEGGRSTRWHLSLTLIRQLKKDLLEIGRSWGVYGASDIIGDIRYALNAF